MQYKSSDLVKLTWNDIQKHVLKIYADVQGYLDKNNLEIDVIVPILRGGGIPWLMLSFMFKSLRILPYQYKYFSAGKDPVLKRVYNPGFDSLVDFNKDKPVVLVVEGNHSTGTIAQKVISDIRREKPGAKIIYVSLAKDYPHKDSVKNIDFTTTGFYTNENRKLSKEGCKRLKISYDKVFIFPWENPEEELAELNSTSFQYRHEPNP